MQSCFLRNRFKDISLKSDTLNVKNVFFARRASRNWRKKTKCSFLEDKQKLDLIRNNDDADSGTIS